MHWAQPMHSSWSPSRMSIPVGQVVTQARQSMQSPAGAGSAGASAAPLHDGERSRLLLLELPPGLTSDAVVAHDQAGLVEEDRLEASVGAGHEAGLLAEPAEVEGHGQADPDHDQEGRGVLGRRARDVGHELGPAHEVGQEGVGQERADQDDHEVLEQAARPAPLAIELGLLLVAALEEPVQRVGTGTPCRPSGGRPSRTTRARRAP